jgi:hypothetical protein
VAGISWEVSPASKYLVARIVSLLKVCERVLSWWTFVADERSTIRFGVRLSAVGMGSLVSGDTGPSGASEACRTNNRARIEGVSVGMPWDIY